MFKSFILRSATILATLLLFVHIPAQSAPDRPSVAIPFCQNDITLDGRLSPGEWDVAAIIHPATVLRGNDANDHSTSAPYANIQTTVRLKYDHTHLYVAITAGETQPGYPEAYSRSHNGNFEQDDSVQVVLGLVEPSTIERGVLEMGGYDGAMDTPVVAADHYYQFNVNAVGARQRMWNERPLASPLFESATTRTDTGWTVEYKIPFASFGATPEILRSIADGSTPLFFNILRHRPPQLIGWHLPGYGGYRAMPFGHARLLPAPTTTGEAARKEQPTRETPPARIVYNGRKPSREARIAIGYYPLQGSIIGIIDGALPAAAATADRAVLRVTDQPATEIKLNPKLQRQLAILPITSGSQPARKAEFILYTKNKPVHTITRELPAVTAPEWHNTDAGSDYIRDKVPPPWTRPVVDASARTIRLVDKTIRMGAFGLPDSVVIDESTAPADTTELLAGPAEIHITASGRELRFTPKTPIVTSDGNSARVTATATAITPSGHVAIDTRTHVDFDGFTEIKLRIRDLPAKEISRLAIRIPVRRDIARYVHRTLVQAVAALDGFGFQTPAGPLWTGNQQGGLAFSYDTPLFFSQDTRRQIRLVEEPDRVWMELNLIDGPGQFPSDDGASGENILRFFLHPTPTRPRPEHTFRPRVTDYKWERWSDWQGYPDLAKTPELQTWATAVTAAGRIPTLYTCQGLAEDSPGFDTFKEDMMIQPPWRFYRRRFNPGKDVNVWATSKRGPEGDLQLWAFRKLANEASISGVLSDGLSIAWADDNPGNPNGGGQPANLAWDADTPTRITAQRTFLKRLRGIFHDTGRPLAMSAHTGGGLDPNTLSFFDYYIEGEQLSRFPATYQPPVASYAIGYSGQPWGFRGTFWVKNWIRSEGPFRALTYALLHDNEIRGNSLLQEVLKEIEPDTSGTPAPLFFPYWRSNSHATMDSRTGESRLSLYLTADKALIVAGNTGLANDTVSLDLRHLFATSGSVPVANIEDILTGTLHVLSEGRVTLPLAPGRCVVLRATSAVRAASLAASAWNASNSLAGWTLPEGAVPGILPDGNRVIILSSKPGSYEARATFSTHSLTPSASAHFLIRPTDNLRLNLGDSSLVWTRARGWSVEGFHATSAAGVSVTSSSISSHAWPSLGMVFDPPLRITDADGRPRFASLKLNLNGRILDATLDDQPLTRGLQWGSPASIGQPLALTLSTSNGSELSFAPASLSSTNIRLYEGGLISSRVAAAPVVPPFVFACIPNERWSVNTHASGVTSGPATIDGKPALTIKSSARNRAVATLDQPLGDTFSAVLRFEKLPARFILRIGSVALRYDGRWVLDGPLNGWGRGVGPRTRDKGPSPQPKIASESPVVLIMSMRDGVLDMVINNELLVRGMAFDIPSNGNVLSLETWAKFDAIFRLEKLSSVPVTLYAPQATVHPVQ
ncbi:hypothetical protein Ga0100231_002180 [Opitutaceae bacterium TAV4]|nr:hypothetical protein Ga0100231_002180 [Opitutaceae bacterium TAV4]RRK01770.1 hypothetical protein Ga0100230_000375 [Opitutaceae bacterium TAV3]